MAARAPAWTELDRALTTASGRPERLGAGGVRRLGELYRAAAADLAYARRRFAHDHVVDDLERLVARGRQAVYAEPPRRPSALAFLGRGYWVLVYERLGAVALSTALLFGPALLAGIWAFNDPGAAIGVVPEDLRGAVEPVGDTGFSAAQTAEFSTAVLTNNIVVTITAFALGFTLGIGTAYVLVSNGVILGALAGAAIEAGNGVEFLEFVAGHGILELSCIVIAGAAGLRIGAAIIDPGPRTRSASLGAEARPAMGIIVGTAPWLVLAGLVEGGVTRAGAGLGPGLAIGIALGATYWALVIWRGRPAP